MGDGEPKLTVVITATAQRELIRIWDFNAGAGGERVSDGWDTFLRKKIDVLGVEHYRGRPVKDFPDLKFISAKKRSRAHGHVILFQVDEQGAMVSVLHLFHTSQDILGRLSLDEQCP